MVDSPNIIWIDENSDGDEISGYVSELNYSGFKKIKCFKTINESLEHLKSIQFKETFIIVSGRLFFPFINEFKANLNQINVIPKIIIFCANIVSFIQNNQQYLINNRFYYMGGIYKDFGEIKNLIINQSKTEKEMLPKREDEIDLIFEYIDRKEKLALPLLYKTLIEVTSNDKIEEFTKYLYYYYQSDKNIQQLLKPIVSMPNIPNELLSKYYSRIYTLDSKFHSDLNEDLRKKHNRDNKYLPFIKLLYEGVKLQSLPLSTEKVLYRGAKIPQKEIEDIIAFQKNKKDKKDVININDNFSTGIVFSKTFMSFSKDLSVAESFLANNSCVNDKIELKKVLFILLKEDDIDIDLTTHADLEQLSFFPGEREVLFFPFSSFEVNSIILDETNNRYVINLSYLGKNEYIRQLNPKNILKPIYGKNSEKESIKSNISNSIDISSYSKHSIKQQTPEKINSRNKLKLNDSKNLKTMDNGIKIINIPNQHIKSCKSFTNIHDYSKIISEKNGFKFKKYLLDSGLIEEKQLESTEKLVKNYEDFKIKQIQIKKYNPITTNNFSVPNYTIVRQFKNPNQQTQIIPPFLPGPENKIENNPQINKIIGTLIVKNDDTNKFIRVINSFENFYRNAQVGNYLNFINENEIKNNCVITIDNKKLMYDFSYFVNIPKPGTYSIEYYFRNNLSKTDFMFADCKNLLNLDLLNFHAENVTNMAYMFYQCSSLESIKMSNLKTHRVKDMSNMFHGCESLKNLDLSFINTQNVENMSRMFFCCKSLKYIKLNNFNTFKVNNMYGMFYGCQSLIDLDLSSFNTQDVINMSRMFSDCKSLENLNISNFTREKVIFMHNLFTGNESLQKLDLTSFNYQKITNTNDMFNGCIKLKPQNIIFKRNALKSIYV